MKCRNCECCHKTVFKRWDGHKIEWVDAEVYQCFGVSEPFEIPDLDHECYAYPERREKEGCKHCAGEHATTIVSYNWYKNDNGDFTLTPIDVNFCPNCGRKMR